MKLLVKASVICTALFSVTQIYASNQITITGEVIDTTCTLAGADGTDNAYDDISIPLDTISASALAKTGDVTGLKAFKMKLTKGDATTPCDTSAKDKFAGITLSSATVESDNVLVNTAADVPATPEDGRVDIQVLTDTDQVVNFTDPSTQAKSTVTQDDDFPTIQYKAQYIRTGAEAVSQPVKAVMTYVFNYN